MTDRAAAIATLERYYDAFNRGDHEAMLACLTEDVAHDINQGGRESGKAAFRAFLVHMAHTYAERLEDIALMVNDDGTRGAAEFIVHGQYLADDEGVAIRQRPTLCFACGRLLHVRGGPHCARHRLL